jgi:hypothetical protein
VTAPVASTGAEALWQKVKGVVGRLDVDADEALVTSPARGGKRKLRGEVEAIGILADALRNVRNPTARRIASKLQKAVRDVERAQIRLRELADLHWPRRGLYSMAEPHLETARSALTHTTNILTPERDLLAAAPGASKDNAASAETLFRQHMVRIWGELCEQEGKRPERQDMIDFLVACEHLALGKAKRDTIRRWVARHS